MKRGIVRVAGIDHVGLGSDFDGARSFPQDLKDVGDLPNITVELMRCGDSDEDIGKILGGNALRALVDVEAAVTQPQVKEEDQPVSTSKNDAAAFVDLDGTLCDTYLWQALFRHHRQLRFKRAAMGAFIAFHMPLWLLSKARLLSRAFFYRTHATNLAWLVGGATIERAKQLWEWLLENETIPHLRPEMQAAIQDHKVRGHRVILLSGSFTPFVDALAIRLGVERAIATPLAVKDGHYTGKIVPPLNVGQGKVERLERFLDGPGQEIDLAASHFYTDSIVDAPVLEMFGHPVAVYPDPELANLAAARGWPVIGGGDSWRLSSHS